MPLDKDPFFDREAKKYTNPIPSREFILKHIEKRKQPASITELSKELEISEDQFEALRRRVKAMLRDEQLEQLKKRRYWPIGKRFLIEGEVKLDKNRYWLIPDDGGLRVEIVSFGSGPVYSGMKVIISVPDVPNEAFRQGKVIEILDEKPKVITGRFVKDAGFNYVIPHSKEVVHDILIPSVKSKKKKLKVEDGDIVVVNLITNDSKWSEPVGKIVEVLGKEDSKGIEIKAAIKGFDIPDQWPKDVKAKVAGLKPTVSSAAKRGRVDLRELPLVTIDGEDAKDFDDAVFCEKKKSGGWRLYVAIADVSYYVREKTELDIEAKKRGNSVYFPANVVPMLPEVLSNGLCSLNAEVDRLCMVCEMSISKSGKLTRYKFYEGLMNSAARLTYTKVHKILNGQSEKLAEKYADLVPHLEDLNEMYKALRVQREERGAIDFETVETKIVFNKTGKISSIEPVRRNVAHKIIEECMLAANVATAKFLHKHKIPGIYRVHEPPKEEKINDLKTFLFEIGVSHSFAKEPKPIDYGNILNKIKNRKDANIIQMILLRSLSQAVYSPDNVGHFGLAYNAYTHFTSPIRRYPDLIVHRQIKSIIKNKWPLSSERRVEKMQLELEEASQHCSMTERRADDATRDVQRWLKCQYMHEHVGKQFSGVVCSVTRFGFFVELDDIYIEGLVHVSSLRDDYFVFDGIHHKLVGEASGFEYKLGMRLDVIVARVEVDERKIDFEILPNFVKSSRKKSKSKKAKNFLDKANQSSSKSVKDKSSDFDTENKKSKKKKKKRKKSKVAKQSFGDAVVSGKPKKPKSAKKKIKKDDSGKPKKAKKKVKKKKPKSKNPKKVVD